MILSRKPQEPFLIAGRFRVNVLEIGPGGAVRLGIVPLPDTPRIDLRDEGPSEEPEIAFSEGEHMIIVTKQVGRNVVINEAIQISIVDVSEGTVSLGIDAVGEAGQEPCVAGGGKPCPLDEQVLKGWLKDKIDGYLKGRPKGALRALAQNVGVSPASVNRWRKGHTNVAEAHLLPLLDALGLSLKDMARELKVGNLVLPGVRPRGPKSHRLLQEQESQAESPDEGGE